MIHKFKTVSALVEAMKSGEIPSEVVSPGAAASALGITRQSVNDRMNTGSLDAWKAEGIVLISIASINVAKRKKFHISEGQGELDVNV